MFRITMSLFVALFTLFFSVHAELSRQEALERIDTQIFSQIRDDHFFSKSDLKKFLTEYSGEELSRITDDFWTIHDHTLANVTYEKKYLATAGGPGSGKSTLLYGVMEERDAHYAFVDPDLSCLFQMKTTYCRDRDAGIGPRRAYKKWRWASNFIANALLAVALDKGCAIAQGTPLTSSKVAKAFNAIKNQYGYHVELLHLSTPDPIRSESIHTREAAGVVQSTWQDMETKGRRFYQKLDEYMQLFDVVTFYYRPTFTEVKVAAVWEDGKLKLVDNEALKGVARLHHEYGVAAKSLQIVES